MRFFSPANGPIPFGLLDTFNMTEAKFTFLIVLFLLNSPLPQAVRTKTGILAPPQPSLHSPEGVTACSLSPHLLSSPLPASGWDLPASHFDMDSLYWLLQFLSLLLVHLRDQCKIKLPESSFDPVSSTPYLDFQNKVQVPRVNTKSPS